MAIERNFRKLPPAKQAELRRFAVAMARALLDSIDTSTLVGLRDRALISVMTFAFARISAVIAMRVEDYYPQGKRWWVRLHEKGGKRHEMPAHHNLEAYLDANRAPASVMLARFPSSVPYALSLRQINGKADASRRCLSHDPAARSCARPWDADRMPHLPGDRYHGLSRQWRHIGKGAAMAAPESPRTTQAL